MENEILIETHPAMVECGFLTKAERKVLRIILKKYMYGNVDESIKILSCYLNAWSNRWARNNHMTIHFFLKVR